jgi:N-acetylmuramoyl-L-alanine amidase
MLKLIEDLILGSGTKDAERETIAPDERQKIRLCLIVGHEQSAPGADFNGIAFKNEYAYNSALAKRVEEKATETKHIEVHVIFRDGIGIKGAYEKAKELHPDVCIELHFNAFNGAAYGTETLCSVDEQDKKLATIVQANVCAAFRRHDLSRGVKILSRADRGGTSVYSLPGSANCLIEPFFGDNKDEAEQAIVYMSEYANSLLESCEQWATLNGVEL